MTRTTKTTYILILAALCSTALAAPVATAPASFTDVLAQIGTCNSLFDADTIAELHLAPEPAAVVANTVRQLLLDLTALSEKNPEAVRAITRTLQIVRASHGEANPNMVLEEYKKQEPYFRSILALMAPARHSILNALTPQQQAQWEAVVIHRRLNARDLANISLSEDQQKQVDAICLEAGQQLLALGDNRSAESSDGVFNHVLDEIRMKVLNTQQRKKFDDPFGLSDQLHNPSNKDK